VFEVMTKNPKSISAEKLAASAVKLMEDAKITSLFVFNDPVAENRISPPVGIVHLHDLLRAGVV